MYKFRSRDRRLMEQTARDLALCLQRDYDSFNPKGTSMLSTRTPFFSGYLSTGANAFPDISWEAGSEVENAFYTLWALLNQLSLGSYQTTNVTGVNNKGVWPVQSARWYWIVSLYATVNPLYKAWCDQNHIPYEIWPS